LPTSQKTKRVLLPQPIEQEAVSLLESANVEIIMAPDKKPEIVLLLKGSGSHFKDRYLFSKDLMNQADDLWAIANRSRCR
jgi:hypothetical protein